MTIEGPTQEVQSGMWRGIDLDVFRSSRKGIVRDATNGGLTGGTEGVDRVMLIGVIDNRDDFGWGPDRVLRVPSDMRLWAPTADCPAVVLVIRTLAGGATAHLAPWPGPTVEERPGRDSTSRGQAGGNFVYGSDSRTWRLIEKFGVHGHYGALAIHDRFERGTTGPGPAPVFAPDRNAIPS